VATALELRSALGLVGGESAYRLLNGEGDGLSGFVADRYGDYVVLYVYSRGLLTLGRLVAEAILRETDTRGVVLKVRPRGGPQPGKVRQEVLGENPPEKYVVKERGIPFELGHEDTYSAVMAEAGEDQDATHCRLCSRLRRGIMYKAAGRLDCNKIALGHHRDDALETLLLNLFYAGRLQAMPAAYTTNDGRFRVIRPLIECGEDRIRSHADAAGYPILPCNLCGSQSELKRVRVARLLKRLEREIPDVRQVMLAALRNVRPSHLLDAEVAEAWEVHAERYPPRR